MTSRGPTVPGLLLIVLLATLAVAGSALAQGRPAPVQGPKPPGKLTPDTAQFLCQRRCERGFCQCTEGRDEAGNKILLEILDPADQSLVRQPGEPYTITARMTYRSSGITMGLLVSDRPDFHDRYNASAPPSRPPVRDPEDRQRQTATFTGNAPNAPGRYYLHVVAGAYQARNCCGDQIYAGTIVKLTVVAPAAAGAPGTDSEASATGVAPPAPLPPAGAAPGRKAVTAGTLGPAPAGEAPKSATAGVPEPAKPPGWPEGVSVRKLDWDTSVVTWPGGRADVMLPKGVVVTFYPGGMAVVTYPDGRTVTDWPDGHRVTRYPDGRTEASSIRPALPRTEPTRIAALPQPPSGSPPRAEALFRRLREIRLGVSACDPQAIERVIEELMIYYAELESKVVVIEASYLSNALEMVRRYIDELRRMQDACRQPPYAPPPDFFLPEPGQYQPPPPEPDSSDTTEAILKPAPGKKDEEGPSPEALRGTIQGLEGQSATTGGQIYVPPAQPSTPGAPRVTIPAAPAPGTTGAMPAAGATPGTEPVPATGTVVVPAPPTLVTPSPSPGIRAAPSSPAVVAPSPSAPATTIVPRPPTLVTPSPSPGIAPPREQPTGTIVTAPKPAPITPGPAKPTSVAPAPVEDPKAKFMSPQPSTETPTSREGIIERQR